MEAGICLFLAGKIGLHALGVGFISKKTIDDGICALGHWDLVKIWAGEMRI
jgi:hypothetical protein